jgi:hypothetical protein
MAGDSTGRTLGLASVKLSSNLNTTKQNTPKDSKNTLNNGSIVIRQGDLLQGQLLLRSSYFHVCLKKLDQIPLGRAGLFELIEREFVWWPGGKI